MGVIEFETEDGLLLEGTLEVPAPAGGPWPGVVVAHPHPQYGGSQDVPLIRTIADELARRGIAALRFNFRGVGNSEGAFQQGEGEVSDVAAAVWALSSRPEIDRTQRGIAGYSFGAWVGLRHFATDQRLIGIAAVGMPLWHQPPAFLRTDTRPKLFIAGSEDDISPIEALRPLLLKAPNAELVTLKGANHYYAAPYQQKVAEQIGEFFAELFETSAI